MLKNVDTKQYATLLGLQVRGVVARLDFPHKDNSGFISNSQGTVKKSLFLSFAKQSPCLESPTPPSGCQPQGVQCKQNKITNAIKEITMQESKLKLLCN
jgi:hypothetical protein